MKEMSSLKLSMKVKGVDELRTKLGQAVYHLERLVEVLGEIESATLEVIPTSEKAEEGEQS